VTVRILCGDNRALLPTLAAESVNCIVTSPPYYGLRDYGVDGQIGLEQTPEAYVEEIVAVFAECRSVLKDTGTLWLNLGDTYARSDKKGGSGFGGKNQAYLGDNYSRARSNIPPGLKPKDLIGIPWMVAFALRADGWYLRQDIIWAKPNPMPESVTDRCTRSHEYLFMLSKKARYFYDAEAISEDAIYVGVAGQDENGFKNPLRFNGKLAKSDKLRGHSRRHAGFNARWDAMTKADQCSTTRNKRSVWTVATAPFSEAHFATFPPALIEPCIKAGCPAGGTVLDPFGGAGTTGLVADRLGRSAILIELNPEYATMAERRIKGDAGMFANIETAEQISLLEGA
jgi:DNA modification methylase